MGALSPNQIRAAAERLIEQAEARGNRLSIADAEAAIVATAELRERGLSMTLASAAAAVAACDRELVAHLRSLCKVLPALGRNPRPFEAALNGNAPPEVLPDTVHSPPPRSRRKRTSMSFDELEDELAD